MSSSTAIFFFTQAQEDFASHGAPVLCRLKEKYNKVHLIAIDDLQELVSELKLDLDFIQYLSVEQLSNIDDLSQVLGKLHTEHTTYYNYSQLSSICLLLGELKKLSEVYGIYVENNKLTASNTHGLSEIERQQDSLNFYESRRHQSTRDHYLKLLGLKPYRKKDLVFIETSKSKETTVLLELSKESTTQDYSHNEELKCLIEAEGIDCIDVSKLRPRKAIAKLKVASAVISNGGYVGILAHSSKVPTLKLLAKNTASEQEQNFIETKQPCHPCLKTTCSQFTRQSSCLDDIH
ncbi:MAG: hypothetical protein NE330_21010, partial [Lentisphaeraceae bacterium]|nr:hypothetical protein [Lentisphaeraceae bacterium]